MAGDNDCSRSAATVKARCAKQPSPEDGRLLWDAPHSLWNGGMLATAIVFGPGTFSWTGAGVALVLGALSILGFSVGLHRHLGHGAFSCSPATRRALAWLGVVSGIAGPRGMVYAHNLSDWAQHHTTAHPFFTHRRGLALHWFWRSHLRIELRRPPVFDMSRIETDKILMALERTWMLQQVPIAIVLWLLGSWPLVVWGVAVRIAATVNVYWTLAHLAHRTHGEQQLHITPGHDLPWAAIPTMGEGWHSNHHAFPASARIGLYPGQSDWGYRFIQLLERFGLAWDVRTPEGLAGRNGPLQSDER